MIGEDYIFIDVPKTGTTAIVNYLLAKDRPGFVGPIHSHIPLSSYIDILGKQAVNDAYVFTVIRNPYARLVSIWKYYNKLKTKYHEIDPGTPTCKDDPHRLHALKYLESSPCFDSYIDDILRYDPPPPYLQGQFLAYHYQFPYLDVFQKSQFKMLNPIDRPIIDRIINIEKMDEGWKAVCEDMGWKHQKLERVNVSGGPSWESFYSGKQKEKLAPFIAPDLLLWGQYQ